MKGVIATVLACALSWLVVAPAAHAQSAPGTAAAPARIRVVSDNNYPPYVFLDANGKPQGYDVDLWRLFQARTGIEVDLEPMSWEAAQQALLSGKADVIDGIDRTAAREPLYDFSSPYATSKVAIYVDQRIRGVRNLATLNGLPVAVERGDACVERLRKAGVTNLHEFTSNLDIIQAAIRGNVLIFCMDESPANYYLYRRALLKRFYKAFRIHTDQLNMAVRKGNDAMLQTVEQGMARITPAERATLSKRWLDEPVVLWPYLRQAGIALAVVLLIVGLMMAWVWLLRRTVHKRTHELRMQEGKLRAIFDATPDAVTVKDRDGTVLDCNDGALRHFGVTREQLLGHKLDNLNDPASTARVGLLDAELLRTGLPSTTLASCDFFGNEKHHYEIRKLPLSAGDDAPYGILTVSRDVTERINAERELRLAAAVFETQEAMLVADSGQVIRRVNAACTGLIGYAEEELVGQPLSMLRSRQHADAFYETIREQVRATGLWRGELWLRSKQGEPKAVRALISRVAGTAGEADRYVYSMVDLTSEHVARVNIDHLTFFDPVTDLPNRFFLNGRLQHILDDGSGAGGALMMIDLDRFKRINELRGHAAGDRLLAQIARRLRPMVGDQCTLGRFGGGTFVVLEACGENTDMTERVQACAKRIHDALLTPFVIDGGSPITITASIGWTRVVPGQASLDNAFKEAELALHDAKASGRDRTRQFRPFLLSDLQHRETLTERLRDAIENDGLAFHLQPQVDRHTRVTGAEMLIRWTLPSGQPVSPSVFIPIAEDCGLILPLGDWVVERACRLLATWARDPRLDSLVLSINVSGRQFAQRGFVAGIRAALERTGARPAHLMLELTESVVLGDLSQVAATLAQLRDMGIGIAMDDFGTGYSSLTYLSQLPFNQLKIDQSFVRHLPDDPSHAMLAKTIITMGRGLGMEVLAEGVETRAQLEFLRANACDSFQGYLFAQPMPAAAFETMLERGAAISANRDS